MNNFIEIFFPWELPKGLTLSEKLSDCHRVSTKNNKLRGEYNNSLNKRYKKENINFNVMSDRAVVKLEETQEINYSI